MAWMAASLGGSPASMCWDAPSTTTIASSTTMPMASTSANRVSRLMLNPSSAMPAKAPMIVTGTVVAGTSVARQFCRNTMMTTSTSSRGLGQRDVDLVDRGLHEKRGVEWDGVGHAGGKLAREAVHLLLHGLAEIERVGLGKLEDGDAGGGLAVHRHELAVGLRAELHAADVSDARDRAPVPVAVLTAMFSNCCAVVKRPRRSSVNWNACPFGAGGEPTCPAATSWLCCWMALTTSLGISERAFIWSASSQTRMLYWPMPKMVVSPTPGMRASVSFRLIVA